MPPDEAVDFEDLIGENLVGEEFDFYGVDGNCFRLNDETYEVVEDGEEFHVVLSEECLAGMPIARVVVEKDGNMFVLVDLHDGHEWLTFGIFGSSLDPDLLDPEFVFEYTPKGPRD